MSPKSVHFLNPPRPLYSLLTKLITLTIIILSLSSSFFRPELKFDGILYDFLGKNLYLGLGSFWKPYFTPDLWPVFLEHPALGFNLIALTYYLFGDFGYNGEVFFILMFPLLILVFWKLYKLIITSIDSSSPPSHFWLFIVMFISMPLIQSVYQKGFLENIIAPFLTASVLFFILSGQEELQTKKWSYFTIACGLIVVGFFIKGPTALFPLATPFFYYLFISQKTKKIKGLIYSTIAFIITASSIGLILLAFVEIQENLRGYFLTRIEGAKLDYYNWETIRRTLKTFFVNELSRPLVISLIIFFISKKIGITKTFLTSSKTPTLINWVKFLLAISLSAYLPLFISPKINGQYVTLSLPYATLGLFLLILPRWNAIVKKLQVSHATIIAKSGILLIIVLIGYTFIFIQGMAQTPSGLMDIQDIAKIKQEFQQNQANLSQANSPLPKELSLCPKLRDPTGTEYIYGFPWFWHIYFKEQLDIDLVFRDIPQETGPSYRLGVQKEKECGDSEYRKQHRENYREIELGLKKYRLWEKVSD